ncbi:uncharacterized mitochondrial protein AtMg00810-like [Pyrus x bretschneideri]|uniref:uncharacterized mitochondrial protein AtMg00810-like n=1 Tax=Pyrus x bretschneideri TaxID=225117 RepID=UPI002030DB86|nr:uncharacterized mitochondrial protein AtMg00810-like [Pyrus x bretschneideri]
MVDRKAMMIRTTKFMTNHLLSKKQFLIDHVLHPGRPNVSKVELNEKLANFSQMINDVIMELTKKFEMKDLGQLDYFLGLQITCQSGGLFVSQSKYIKDLLNEVDLQDSKLCPTPCLPYHRLIKDNGTPYHNLEQYRSIVGALQYLTFTRPNIAFSVNQCCQFMHNPMNSDVVAVKRTLRCLSGTIDYGLNFKPGKLHLQVYSDAD